MERPTQENWTCEDDGVRLDHFLSNHLADWTRSRLKRVIQEGGVQVNRKVVTKAGTKLRAKDRIAIAIPEPEPMEAIPQDIPLTVLYEDESVIVVNKPPFFVVHPAPGHPDGTLVNALLHHCPDLRGVGGVLRPGIVHRLDKDTSGVLVVAKSDHAHKSLTEQLAARTMKRVYLAMVMGSRLEGRGHFSTLYGRAPNDRFRYSSKVREGKHAVTHWEIVARGAICSLVRVQLETGRTHQIRVHFADHGHPIVGDPLYGKSLKGFDTSRNPVEGRAIASHPRQALHALQLEFVHPTSHLSMRFHAEVPSDMRQAATAAFGDAIWEQVREEFDIAPAPTGQRA